MAINTWWDDDPAQRYWMQITDRHDLEDGPLLSPKLPHLEWGYDLVSQVQPGDRVLHWRARAERGLVGWSEVEEYATVIPEYTWKPHHGGPERTTLGWQAVLGQFHFHAAGPVGTALADPRSDSRRGSRAPRTAQGQPLLPDHKIR